MTDDILERLTQLHVEALRGDGLQCDEVADIAHGAAEEIKALRAQVAAMNRLVSGSVARVKK